MSRTSATGPVWPGLIPAQPHSTWLAGMEENMADTPFEWWEYDTAGTQVLPVVVGPEIPSIPMSDAEHCEMAGYESLARMMAAEAEHQDTNEPALPAFDYNVLDWQRYRSVEEAARSFFAYLNTVAHAGQAAHSTTPTQPAEHGSPGVRWLNRASTR